MTHTVEKIIKVPVERLVEKIIQVPVVHIKEQIVEVPVEKIVERIGFFRSIVNHGSNGNLWSSRGLWGKK